MPRRRSSYSSAAYSGWKSKHTRRADADFDHAWEVQKQKQREAALAAAQEAVGTPAANDGQTEEKQNG